MTIPWQPRHVHAAQALTIDINIAMIWGCEANTTRWQKTDFISEHWRHFAIKSGDTISASPIPCLLQFHSLGLSSSTNLSRESAKCCNSLVVPQLWQCVKSVGYGAPTPKCGVHVPRTPKNDAYVREIRPQVVWENPLIKSTVSYKN